MGATPVLRFGDAEAEAAHAEWGFNCGPGALCGLLGLTPNEIRPRLLDFERKGYTNSTLMRALLRELGQGFADTSYRDPDCKDALFPTRGVALVQWDGPWTRPGVPRRARHRYTHWVASVQAAGGMPRIYDVNWPRTWLTLDVWSGHLVPRLLKDVKRANGKWWIRTALEVYS